MEQNQNKKLLKVINTIIDAFLFILSNFVLLCFRVAFRADFYAFTVIRIINVLVFYRYFFLLRNNLFHKVKRFPTLVDALLIFAMWLISSIINYFVVYTFGYFEISLVLGR